MAEDGAAAVEEITDLRTVQFDSEIQVRDLAKRELDVRLVPWNHTINTLLGPEEFARGAFAGIRPEKVHLMEPDHEARMGIGQDGRPVARRRAIGKGTSLEERDDGAYMTVKVASTASGDEVLALASDGIYSGVSPEFYELPGGTSIENRNGRRVRVHRRVNLVGLSTTYQPAYGEQSAVLAVRSSQEGDGQMAESQEPAAAAAPEPAVPAIVPSIDLGPVTRALDDFTERFQDRIERLETRSRQDIVIPPAGPVKPDIHKGHWMQTVLAILSGGRAPELQTRAMADLITTDNAGVVPEAFSTELIGVIDPRRPFLNTTRRVPTPDSGMTLNMPVLTTRPTAGVQVNEKDDITSTTTSITSSGFDAITIAGGGDISLQLLKRSSPSYLDLYLRLLAEALAKNSETEAVAALLAAGITPGTGTLDPEALVIGEAWANGQAVGLVPDTMWLSSDAVAKFIDAKSDGTNAPLYSGIASNFTVGGGVGGGISGLRPVYVPALDGSGSDVVIGPSNGFAWAEDGTFTLQVDVPAKAGRDVALVVIDWFAPLYPAAFTEYSV